MNRNYQKGRRYEYKLIKLLKANGAIHAVRSAGSHSPFDVIAVFPEYTYFAQLKATKAKVTKEDMDAFRAAVKEWPYGAVANLLHWPPGEKEPKVILEARTKLDIIHKSATTEEAEA